MSIDPTHAKFKEYILTNQNDQKIETVTFAETHETLETIISELTDTLKNPSITLGISGGGLFSIISYEIVEYLIKRGIKINEVIGNSGGSLVGALVATNNVKKEYLDNIFSHMTLSMSKYLKIPGIVTGLMTPFLCEFSYKGELLDIKDFLVNESDSLIASLSHEKILKDGKIQEEILKRAVISVLIEKNFFAADSEKEIYANFSLHKYTFNDIKNQYKIDFKVMASVIKGKLNLRTLQGWKDLKKVIEFKKVTHNGEDFLQGITFTGDFSVLDSLVVSTFGLPQKITVKGKSIKALDGMLSWNDFPYAPKHYAGQDPNTPTLLIHTPGITPPNEENKGVRPKELSYGKNKYVISPDIDGKIQDLKAHFNSNYIPSLRKIAKELIYGIPMNSEDK